LRVDWTFEAVAHLDGIYSTLLPFSERSAQEWVVRINERVLSLRDFPRLGRIVPEYRIERFRELIEPPYRIMYQVFADRVEIVAIRHSAELLPGD